jgi:YHS domain-containing protein/thiol-disulfide isomerase/thioredoxin
MTPYTRLFAAMLLLGLAAPSLGQNALRWESSLEEAQRQAAATNRLVLVHFSASWCQPCQRLEKQVFSHPGFGQSLAARYVAVKLDFDEHQALATRWGVQSIPTDVVLSPQGQPIQRIQSPPSADAYVAAMQRVADYAVAAAPASPAVSPSAPAAAATSGAGNAATVGDRYANYNASQPPQQPRSSQPPVSAPAWTESSNGAEANVASAAAGPVAHQVAASNWQNAERRPDAIGPTSVQLPPDCPVLGLDGFCPVTLIEKRAWAQGDARWGAIHRNRTYLFCSEAEQKQFLANPDHYSPVMSGDDAVLATDAGRSVPGERRYGVFFGNRVYLFQNEQTLKTFAAHPNRYAAEISQVMRP